MDLGASPAEMAYNRRLRTPLPALPATLAPRIVNHDRVQERDMLSKFRQKAYYDHHHGARVLPDLSPETPVLVKLESEKGWKQPAVVRNKCAPRSYIVETSGGELRRNRKHLRQYQPPDPAVNSNPVGETLVSASSDPVSSPHLSQSSGPPVQSMESPAQPTSVPESFAMTQSGRQIVKPARYRE